MTLDRDLNVSYPLQFCFKLLLVLHVTKETFFLLRATQWAVPGRGDGLVPRQSNPEHGKYQAWFRKVPSSSVLQQFPCSQGILQHSEMAEHTKGTSLLALVSWELLCSTWGTRRVPDFPVQALLASSVHQKGAGAQQRTGIFNFQLWGLLKQNPPKVSSWQK